MKILSQTGAKVKNSVGAFSPPPEDKALVETNLSAGGGPLGASAPPLLSNPLRVQKRKTRPATTDTSLKPVDNMELDVAAGSSPVSVGLFPIVVNSDTFAMIEIVESYRRYCYKKEHSPGILLHLKNKQDGSTALQRVNGTSDSRYFAQGRAAKIRKIRRRFTGTWERGVFFTLTVDPKRYDLTEAWKSVWKEFDRSKRALNKYRERHMNCTHGIWYLAAIEQQKSHYPHLHVYCPGLRWLIKTKDLSKMDEWWGMGSATTKQEHNLHEDSASSYLTKYLSKLAGWDEVSMALIWKFRIRTYNFSRHYKLAEPEGEWELLEIYKDAEALAEGLDMEIKRAEALVEAWADMDDDFITLTSP